MTPSVVVETSRSFLLGCPAVILQEDRELAWAERHVQHNPAYKWVLGRFVEAERANLNGHIFPLEDLPAAQQTLLHSPMNMVHQPRDVVGTFVASELVYPTGGATEASTGATADEYPVMEALAAFWRYYFPEAFDKVDQAYKDGALAFSMEAVPEEMTCGTDGCGMRVKYDGRVSSSYCAHLNTSGMPKRLHKPHFTGGALILPPVKPGWAHADVKELSSMKDLSSLIRRYSQEAEAAYLQMKQNHPHLGPSEWESMMASLLLVVDAPVEGEWARKFSAEDRKKLADKGFALPDGSYPIETVEDLGNAIKAYGHNPTPTVKAHIIKRARALHSTDLLPEGWNNQ